MKNKIKKLIVALCTSVIFCVLPLLVCAVTIPEGNPTQERVAWWSVTGGNAISAENASYELSFDSDKAQASQYEGLGDFAFGMAAPGGGEGFEIPDGVSAAYFMTQFRRSDNGNAVRGGNLCFRITDGFYTSNENEYSFYIEYWSEEQSQMKFGYPQKTGASTHANNYITLSLEQEAEWNVARVEVTDAWLQTLTASGKHSYNQIFLTGMDGSWFDPRKAPIYVRRLAVVPKDVVDTLKNPDNVFDPINMAQPASNSAVMDGEANITYSSNKATITVDLKDVDYETGSLNLIAYAFREDGDYIVASAMNTEAVDSNINTLTLSTEVNVPTGCVLKYMIVDNNGKVIDNAAPSEMGEITLTSKVKNVTVSWEAPQDDFGCSYVVYKDGVEIGTTKNTFYKDETAIGGESYRVKAIDHAGEETELSAEQTASELIAPYYVNTGGGSSNGVTVNISSDTSSSAYCAQANVEGEACVTTVATDTGSTYLHVTADRNVIKDTDREVSILVDYYDDGSADAIEIEYSGYGAVTNGMQRKGIPYVTGTEGAGWKQAEFSISNAHFTRSQTALNNCDFRIRRISGEPLAVSLIQIVLTPLYE